MRETLVWKEMDVKLFKCMGLQKVCPDTQSDAIHRCLSSDSVSRVVCADFQRRPLFPAQIHSKTLHLNPSAIRWAVPSTHRPSHVFFLFVCFLLKVVRSARFLSLRRRRSSLPCPTLRSLCGCRTTHSDAKLWDPFTLAQKDLTSLYDDIKKVSIVFSWVLRKCVSDSLRCVNVC